MAISRISLIAGEEVTIGYPTYNTTLFLISTEEDPIHENYRKVFPIGIFKLFHRHKKLCRCSRATLEGAGGRGGGLEDVKATLEV